MEKLREMECKLENDEVYRKLVMDNENLLISGGYVRINMILQRKTVRTDRGISVIGQKQKKRSERPRKSV